MTRFPVMLGLLGLAVLAVIGAAELGLLPYSSWRLFGSAPAARVQFVLPTASGLALDQAVAITGVTVQEDAGRIVDLAVVTEGVLVTVELSTNARLPESAQAVLRPGTPPRPSTLELTGGEVPELPAAGSIRRIPAVLQMGPPDGLIEPLPEWPLGSRP